MCSICVVLIKLSTFLPRKHKNVLKESRKDKGSKEWGKLNRRKKIKTFAVMNRIDNNLFI